MEKTFFNNNGLYVAKNILGKFLIRKYKDTQIVTKIVETEAYMGIKDKAAHVYNDKKTDRTKPLYLEGGHIYVYLIYGMYHCLNISANIENIPECVLIRSVEPIIGLEKISLNRYQKTYKELNSYQKKNITNGPGKLCMAMDISRDHNRMDLCGEELYLEDDGFVVEKIIASKRINIDYAEEAVDFLWRFSVKDHPLVSKKI